jgi:hypothetical protein
VELIIMLLAPVPIGYFIRNRMAAYLAYDGTARGGLPAGIAARFTIGCHAHSGVTSTTRPLLRS